VIPESDWTQCRTTESRSNTDRRREQEVVQRIDGEFVLQQRNHWRNHEPMENNNELIRRRDCGQPEMIERQFHALATHAFSTDRPSLQHLASRFNTEIPNTRPSSSFKPKSDPIHCSESFARQNRSILHSEEAGESACPSFEMPWNRRTW